MTIKRKLLLNVTVGAVALALTVPMTFAACPVNSECSRSNTDIVTPDTATCSKCKKSDCSCNKKGFNLFNRKSNCGCDPCEQPKSDCGCPTGGAAPCIETKPLNQQTYAYPNAI